MSTPPRQKRLTPADITALKGNRPIVSLTAYTTPIGRILDRHCDLLLVGDSLGMVLYGMDTTVGVTMDMMVAHGQAVMRGVSRACVIVDLPFGAYQESKEQAFRNAVRLMKETGCDGVKLEGGAEMAETVAFLVSRGVPVFGHIGLMPQQVNTSGGYRSKGHSEAEQDKIRRDAKEIDEAGAFAMVIEGTVEPLAREITTTVKAATIGIGASPACDGQILVSDDMLGLFNEFKPRFVKHYSELAEVIEKAAEGYAAEVKERVFPGQEHTFQIRPKK
uniref:3-methyl-2-oxobutanoate hydroxymethyltransferase n=1 Tax=Agrobacterium albertimagni TaxID=147266 RepID=A0A7C1SZ48_9HYPH